LPHFLTYLQPVLTYFLAFLPYLILHFGNHVCQEGGLEAAATSTTSPGTMAAPTGGVDLGGLPHDSPCLLVPRRRVPCAEANQPAWRAVAPAEEAGPVLRAFVGARPAEPCLFLLKGRKSRYTEKWLKQGCPQILTRSGARPIVPAGRPLGPRSPQMLPRVGQRPALTPPPPRTPEAPRGRPARAMSRQPREQLPARLAQALALEGHAGRPDPPESPQLSRPRGQVPPRPASAPRTGTPSSRPQTLVVSAHLEAALMTPGPASDPD
jgi:hypothetical protein